MPTEVLTEHSCNGPDNIGLIVFIVIPENATKLITKNLKGRRSCEDEARHKPCPNLLEHTSIIVNVEESKISNL